MASEQPKPRPIGFCAVCRGAVPLEEVLHVWPNGQVCGPVHNVWLHRVTFEVSLGPQRKVVVLDLPSDRPWMTPEELVATAEDLQSQAKAFDAEGRPILNAPKPSATMIFHEIVRSLRQAPPPDGTSH
jgi:hypothetical protein